MTFVIERNRALCQIVIGGFHATAHIFLQIYIDEGGLLYLFFTYCQGYNENYRNLLFYYIGAWIGLPDVSFKHAYFTNVERLLLAFGEISISLVVYYVIKPDNELIGP